MPINKTGKKIAVFGSRSFQDKDRLFKILDKNKERIKLIVSGGAVGADSFANEWAKERGFPILIIYPQWHDANGVFVKGAGFQRNRDIVEQSDVGLAFWDGSSSGTKNSIDIFKQLGRPIKIFNFTPEEIELDLKEEPVINSPENKIKIDGKEKDVDSFVPVGEVLPAGKSYEDTL
jgi:hypothetical protein